MHKSTETKQDNKIKLNLSERLRRLPASQQRLIKCTTIRNAGVSEGTWYKNMSGKRATLVVIIALAKVLNCTVDQILDVNYAFKSPNLKEKPTIIASDFGLSKPLQ